MPTLFRTLFRKFVCGLSKEDVAALCLKSVTTITRWDEGNPIPPECKRLMHIYTGMELAIINPKWKGWRIRNGNALLEIDSENESTFKDHSNGKDVE